MAELIYNFISGRFGNKVLNPPYRTIWRAFWAVVLTALFLMVMYYVVQGWAIVVEGLNRAIWHN